MLNRPARDKQLTGKIIQGLPTGYREDGSMLSPFTRVARAINRRRQFLKLSQRQVAVEVGCSQSYLAQVETGQRPISRRFAEKLESFFEVKPGSYTDNVIFRRGRPPKKKRRPKSDAPPSPASGDS